MLEPTACPIGQQIAMATTHQALEDLWRSNQAAWTDEHTIAVKARLRTLSASLDYGNVRGTRGVQ